MILEDLTIDEWLDVRYEDGREKGREEYNQYVLKLIDQGLSLENIKQRLQQKQVEQRIYTN